MRSQKKIIKKTSGPAVLSGKSPPPPPRLQPPSSQPRSFETVNVWENPKHCWNVSAMKLSYSWAANSSGFVCVRADCLAFHRWKSEMVRQKSVEQHQCKAILSWGRIWSSLLWPELWSASQGSKKTSKGTSIYGMLVNLVRWNIHVLSFSNRVFTPLAPSSFVCNSHAIPDSDPPASLFLLALSSLTEPW